MLRTSILAVLLALGGYAAIHTLTHGFQVWTDEGARRLEVSLSPITLPDVEVEGPWTEKARLPALLQGSGHITVADFIYTHCTTICLTLSRNFQQMQTSLQNESELPGNEGVRLLTISFDGARDTPEVLGRYARSWRADPERWQFVHVPDPAEQAALLRQLGVVVVPDGLGDFEHNAALLILDADGRMVRIFDLEERQLALNYARHLASRQAQHEQALQ